MEIKRNNIQITIKVSNNYLYIDKREIYEKDEEILF